jgi:alpha-L-glutamate ligase-like protein
MISRYLNWWRQGPGSGDVLGINRRNLDLVFADYKPGKFQEMDDKLAAKKLMEAAGVNVPRTLGSVSNPVEIAILENLLTECESLVLKPSNGFGGKGIWILRKVEGHWTRAGAGRTSLEEIKRHVGEIMSGIYSLDESDDTAICEELIIPHSFFANLGPEGLCDIRIVLENNVPLQAMCRVPTEASDGKANLHGGGVGLGVNLDDGKVNGALVGDERITSHPDTGLSLLGLQLPDWPQCVALAVAASHTVDVKYMGVDIVVDGQRGPLILEINARPGLAIQIANATGQPAVSQTPSSRLDLATTLFNWFLLFALALSPLGYHWWQSQFSEALVFDLSSNETRSVVVATPEAEEGYLAKSEVNQIEEINLGDTNQSFRDARSAAAAGDTRQALRLYKTVLADSSLAPFALNNMAILAGRAGQDSLAVAYLTEAVTRFPVYYRGLYNLGVIWEKAGRSEKAREAFEKALSLKPNHAPTWAALGNLDFDDKAFAEAATNFSEAIRFDPTMIGSRFKLGLALRKLKDFPAAQASFEEQLSLDPSSESGVYWLARTYRDRALETKGEASSFSDQAQALLAAYSPRTPRINSLLGSLAFERGDLLLAQDIFEEMTHGKYRPGYHHLALAVTEMEMGNWVEAYKAAEAGQRHGSSSASRLMYLTKLAQAISDPGLQVPDPHKAPNAVSRLMAALMVENHRLVGTTLAELEESIGAENVVWAKWLVGRNSPRDHARAMDFPDALSAFIIDPGNLGSHLDSKSRLPLTLCLYLGYVAADQSGNPEDVRTVQEYLRTVQPHFLPLLRKDFSSALAAGRPDEAMNLGKRILELGFDDPNFVLDLASLNIAQGKPRTARKLMRSIPKKSRKTPSAIIIKSRLAIASEQYPAAIKLLKKLLKRDPDNLEARFALGEARFAKGDFRRAASDLRKAVDLAPGRPDIRQVLAQSLMKRRKYSASIHEWFILLSLDPDDLSARFNYALCLQRTDDFMGALLEYDRILAVDPLRSSAVYNRALALENLGRPREAQEAYKSMLELVPTHAASLRKLELLEGNPLL